MPESSTAIGIDLGTTNSCVAVFKNGRVEVIANALGNRTMPSMVSFTNTERYIGDSAKSYASQNPTNTIYAVKRLIGRKYKDELLQKDMKMWPFRVVNDWSKLKIAVTFKKKEKKFTPQEISAMILSKLKETAETFLEHEVKEAVITVPAYFNDAQKKATMDAGKIAELKVLLVLSEPTAAAIAYGMDKRIADERNILIYDFGGGTFDVSIMTIKNGVFKVKGVTGETHLGGEDIDNRLVAHFINDIKKKYMKDIMVNKTALSRLKIACENAKITLSSQLTARIQIDNLVDGIDYEASILRSRFEHLNEDLFTSTIMLVQKALTEANMDRREIHNVVLVGGSTRIPKVQSLLEEFFGGKKLCKSINQDEAVAYGAAVQAAVLKGVNCEVIKDLQINHVTPFSLGIETDGGYTCVLIKRNTAIPTSYTKTFTTTPGANEFKINIYEGEQTMFKDNNCLGNFVLKGFPASTKGVNVKVTFGIDLNSTLTVSAVTASFHMESRITITNDQDRLTSEDIDYMARKENKYKIKDEKQRKCEVSKCNLYDCIGNIETKIAEDVRKKIGKSDKQKILDLCKNVSAWLDDDQPREVEDYLAKQVQLEKLWKPMLKKLK